MAREVTSILRAQVLLALLTTVLGFAGVFVVMTYIQPLLMRVGGFSDNAVSLALLLFGIGMILSNMRGWQARRIADVAPGHLRDAGRAGGGVAADRAGAACRHLSFSHRALLGAAAFATVSPLQMRVLHERGGRGSRRWLRASTSLRSTSAMRWARGWAVLPSHAVRGLASLGWIAALLPIAGLFIAYAGLRLERRRQWPPPPLPPAAS